MIEDLALSPGTRYRIVAPNGAVVRAGVASDSRQLHHLPSGVLVVCAERGRDVGGRQCVRIASPAGWVNADALGPVPAVVKATLDYDTFTARHRQVSPGDHYGLEFPIDLAGLREAGPAFLTAAFRASGALSADNRVTQIVSLNKLDIRGASENGLLTLAYARDEPGLQTHLFVKFPPADAHHKYGLLRLSDGEIRMARLSRERQLPVTVSRYYFGDHSSHTGNYILITERVPFGVGTVEPAYRKGYDHEVPCVEEHYAVLTRNLARLVAAHKRGDLGHDLEEIFPFAAAARDFEPIAHPEPALDRLIDFIGRVAPHLFAPEVTRPQFLARWREDVLFGLEHKDAVLAYLLSDVDYTGLCHINLNVDNAWFWRDEGGQLHAGLLDWGGAGQASLAQALSGMMMMPEPEKHIELVNRMIDLFIEECSAQGGPSLDRAELHFQYKASVYSTAIFMFITILSEALKDFPEDYFTSMEHRMDPRLLEGGFYSAIVWIDNMLREWLDPLTPGEACRRIVAVCRLFPVVA
ncbi:hypothetical protein [Sphingobium sp. EP60837]|jgi:hypothetical protein|uniref:hypothetical protein n=1 Tax=Sphingobium sp. EP60837 TaxID=1855519 RepID=UPI0007DD442B|nr:hypothetical protein [Sphingobium sp. EP60837]ANI77701.1 hypothetical protein EP837_01272 [Sphingobium sp. EP60837]